MMLSVVTRTLHARAATPSDPAQFAAQLYA
jgi:hypothetical protein